MNQFFLVCFALHVKFATVRMKALVIGTAYHKKDIFVKMSHPPPSWFIQTCLSRRAYIIQSSNSTSSRSLTTKLQSFHEISLKEKRNGRFSSGKGTYRVNKQ